MLARERVSRGTALFGCVIAAALSSAAAACGGSELDECNAEAARELVYGRNGSVATKGQALAHDSCGNGSFCHSQSATGELRHGAPSSMNFDMLPSPRGLEGVLEHRERSWELVDLDEMPPPASKEVLGHGDWSFDPQRHPDAPGLPPLSTEKGKAAFRNWLACGAPTVSQTAAPVWARPDLDFPEGEEVAWDKLYDRAFKGTCAIAGCHATLSAASGLAMEDACQARSALLGSGACGRTWVVPGKPDESYLVAKLEPGEQECGQTMPNPQAPLPESIREAVRAWIEAGAKAECP